MSLRANAAAQHMRADAVAPVVVRLAGAALLLGLALVAYYMLARAGWTDVVARRWDRVAVLFVHAQATAFAAIACVALVDPGAADGAGARMRYAAALIAGNAIAAAVVLALLRWTGLPHRGPGPGRWVLYIQIEYLLITGGALFVLLDRRRAQAAQARLHTAQQRRLHIGKQALETRLQAMQARVEPRFLFDALASIHRLHPQDPPRAERLLDELIAYLRAAMPRAGDPSSTLGRETDLVRSWLSVVGNASGRSVDHCIDVAPELLDARVPPMLLLPLVRWIFDQRAPPGPAAPFLRVTAAPAGQRLELRVSANAASGRGSGGPDLARLRERVAALWGDTAQLRVAEARDPPFIEAVLDAPLELDAAGTPEGATRGVPEGMTGRDLAA